MGTKRSCLGACSLDGLMFCCGGYDGASCLSSVERLDPLTGVWTSCPAMSTRRRYCRVAVLGKKRGGGSYRVAVLGKQGGWRYYRVTVLWIASWPSLGGGGLF